MNSPIIQLQNRVNLKEVTDPVQVDMSSDSDFLSALLNTLFSKESKYVFYYGNERLVQNLGYVIEKHDLNIESTILIHYTDEENMACDFVRECDDVVIGMEWFQNNLFYVTYGGLVLSLRDTFECPLPGIKGIFSGEKLFGFSEHSVYDIESHQEICRFEEEIRSCYASVGGLIVVATDGKVFLLNADHMPSSGNLKEDTTVPTLEFPRSVLLSEQKVYWAEGHNRISVYSLEEGTKRFFDCDSTINSLKACGSTIFATTANSKIIRISDDSMVAKEISSRSSNHIELVGNVLLYSTQHEIIGLGLDDLQELSFAKVDGQINDMVVSDEMVYVANGQRISGFLRHRFSG